MNSYGDLLLRREWISTGKGREVMLAVYACRHHQGGRTDSQKQSLNRSHYDLHRTQGLFVNGVVIFGGVSRPPPTIQPQNLEQTSISESRPNFSHYLSLPTLPQQDHQLPLSDHPNQPESHQSNPLNSSQSVCDKDLTWIKTESLPAIPNKFGLRVENYSPHPLASNLHYLPCHVQQVVSHESQR